MTDKGGHPKRISWEQRQDLVKIYLRDGLEEAQKVATGLGLSQKYVQRLLYALGISAVLVMATPFSIYARDPDGRYANSPLKKWFDGLHSKKGPCCSDADGTALSDVDWESKDGHYRVKIDDKWWDVPDDAVLTEPNLAGRTMVWPIRYWNGDLKIVIRCFIVGAQG